MSASGRPAAAWDESAVGAAPHTAPQLLARAPGAGELVAEALRKAARIKAKLSAALDGGEEA